MQNLMNSMRLCGYCGSPMAGKVWDMGHGIGKRKFYTKKGKIEWLENEIKEAEMELTAMREKLADFQK